MKKIILLLSIILMLSGCASGKEESSRETSEYMPAEIPQEVSVQRDTGELLESTFIKLWKSDTVYIEAEMTVEGKSDEKSIYKYVIAGDKKINQPCLKWNSLTERKCIISLTAERYMI